jgi:hypothetical protein
MPATPRLRSAGLRALGAIALLAAAAPTQALAHAPGSPVQRGATAAQSGNQPAGCTTSERRRALAEDQRLVLARVGALTTIDDVADFAALAGRGWNVPPHGWNSFRGMGVAALRGGELARPEPLPGRPELLLYRPDPGASDVTDPFGADFPYRLAGWGYLGSYDFARHPTGAGPCFRRADWFVHERGIHDFQTLGFVPVPPKEDFHGQDPGDEPFAPFPPGVPHPRFWDMHLWLGAEGVPTVSMLNPGTPIPGIDPRVGVSFFYPPASARADQTPGVSLTGMRLSRKRFRAARRGRAVAPRGRRLGRRVGTRVRYRLSHTARVTFRVQRARRRKGRWVGGRCRRRTPRNAERRRCTRYRTLRGRVVRRGEAGVSRWRFTGRWRGRRLRHGRYRLIARAYRGDRRSQHGRARFRIVRP